MNSQCCLNALHAVGRYLLVQSIFGAESPSMSSLSSDEGFSESLLSFSTVLAFVFWRNSISLLTPCYVLYHTTAILNLKPRGLLHPMMLIVLS